MPKDWREAAKWYLKAAEQGDTKAQKNLGVMYRSGKGVVKDDKEAVKWYRKAAEQGDAGAQTSLGAMYYNGGGILEDYETAYAWFNIAAANGDEYAKRNKLIVTKKMTPEQIAKAQELSREMIKKNPKLLNK